MHPSRTPQSPLLLLPVLVGLALGGCASKEFVQQEVGVANQRIDELSGKLATAYQRIDGNALLILDSNKRIGATEQSGVALNQRVDTTQASLAEAGQHIETVSANLEAATQLIDVNTSEIARANQRIDAIDERLASTQKRVLGTEGRIVTAESRLGSLENTLSALGQGGEVTTSPYLGAQNPQAEATTPIAASQPSPPVEPSQRLEQIAAQIAAASQRIDSNTSALNAAAERVGKVEASLADTAKRVQGSEVALQAANQRIGEVQGQMARSEQHIAANNEAIASANKRVDTLQGNLETTSAKLNASEQAIAASTTRIGLAEANIAQQGERLARNEAEDTNISATAKEALARASAAGELAEGKLLYDTVLSEERVGFAPYKTTLTDEDKQALKQFGDKLVAENQNIYLEIQGYTDNSGPAAANLRLSRERADSVRTYLHDACGIPLHRIATAAYGETQPIADNSTKEGRSKNRRVVIVVLK